MESKNKHSAIYSTFKYLFSPLKIDNKLYVATIQKASKHTSVGRGYTDYNSIDIDSTVNPHQWAEIFWL